MHLICRCVCPPICACSNSYKYFSKVLKFICVIHITYSIDCIENCMGGAKDSTTEKDKIFTIRYGGNTYEGIFLKRILTYSYCTKCSKINICHFDVQNHTIKCATLCSYKKQYKYSVFRLIEKYSNVLWSMGEKY